MLSKIKDFVLTFDLIGPKKEFLHKGNHINQTIIILQIVN